MWQRILKLALLADRELTTLEKLGIRYKPALPQLEAFVAAVEAGNPLAEIQAAEALVTAMKACPAA